MKIGIMSGATAAVGNTVDSIINFAQRVEQQGFSSLWMANIFGLDAVTTLSIVGRETSRIELGTAVTPTYPRHPSAMAQQALTAGAACGGRFTLGIGLSHKLVIEDFLGMSYEKPAKHMEEYLQVLGPLLRREPVSFSGDYYKTSLTLDVPEAQPVPLIVAALGPQMLKLAGSLADGTTTWMVGPQTLEEFTIPTLVAAATSNRCNGSRIVAGLPIVVTNQVDAAKAAIAKELKIYGMMPSYRAMLDREGASGPEDIALVGDEQVLREEINRLREIGVTDFNAAIVPVAEGDLERTLGFLESEI